ncbi:MAG: sugar ABC transporter permease [Clostridiales bacterium]|nr:sugar ABC transporter permease [Clostridiales bacterium]
MNKLKSGLGAVGQFFADFGHAVADGDIFVKLSLVWFGAGYLGRKQYVKTIIMTLYEAAIIAYTVLVGIPYISDFGTLGTVQQESVFNPVTMKNEFNDYDNSFTILLFSVITLVVWAFALYTWMYNVKNVYRLQKESERGRHINNFREDLNDYINHKFYVTLLALPVAGVVLFTVVPLLVMIFVAFTNYDQNHMPPSALFDWTGLKNFISLFGGGGLSDTFGYAFVRVLGWTLVWSFFATLTTYFGGILMSLLINGKDVRGKAAWRVLFMITIAVPQFVSLLLVRNFFADNGIMNTILSNIGLTGFLQDIGLISNSYIPFLTAPGWAHVMIILINIWIGVPYQMLIANGVLMNIPSEQLESASIDGANSWQTFRNITMPYVFSVTGPALVTDFVKNINNFNVIYLLTSNFYTTTNQAMANSQAKETDLLVTWLFTLTQDYYNYKMAATIGIIIFVICALFTLIVFNKVVARTGQGDFAS